MTVYISCVILGADMVSRDPFNVFRSTGLLISLAISLPLPKLIQNVPSNLAASTNIPPNTRMGSQSHFISSVKYVTSVIRWVPCIYGIYCVLFVVTSDIDDPSTSDRRFLDSFRPVSIVSASAAMIHSATLVSLIQFGMSYAKIPLLPLPPRCDGIVLIRNILLCVSVSPIRRYFWLRHRDDIFGFDIVYLSYCQLWPYTPRLKFNCLLWFVGLF